MGANEAKSALRRSVPAVFRRSPSRGPCPRVAGGTVPVAGTRGGGEEELHAALRAERREREEGERGCG